MFLKNKTDRAQKPAAKKEGALSIVTQGMHIIGNIVSEGVIDFDGTLDGNLRCQTVTIRENATVKGEVTSDTAFIFGRVNGLIRAKVVHLHATCRVEGIVMHETLTMEDGAFLDGKCKRTDKVMADEKAEETVIPAFGENSEPISKMPMLENLRLIR